MDERDYLIQELKGEQKALQDKLERLRRPLVQVEEDLKHVSGAIAFLERKNASVSIVLEDEGSIAATKLKGLTQLEAIVAIAKSNNGTVKAQDAKRILIKAGVMRNTKNSTNITHNVILRSDKFERTAPGEYRLKGGTMPKNAELENAARASLFGSKPVQ